MPRSVFPDVDRQTVWADLTGPRCFGTPQKNTQQSQPFPPTPCSRGIFQAKLVAEMRIEAVKAEVAQVASRPKNESDLLNSSVSVAKEEAAKQARLEELLSVKSPASAEVDEFLQPKFVPPSALDRAQDVGKLDVNTIESDIKGGEDEVDLGPIETPMANPEIAENYAAALETPFAEREAAVSDRSPSC